MLLVVVSVVFSEGVVDGQYERDEVCKLRVSFDCSI